MILPGIAYKIAAQNGRIASKLIAMAVLDPVKKKTKASVNETINPIVMKSAIRSDFTCGGLGLLSVRSGMVGSIMQ
jgi:hypothetical protein